LSTIAVNVPNMANPRPKLKAVPMTIKRAIPLVRRWHRKLPRIQGGLFALGVARADTGQLCGVAIVGRACRMLDSKPGKWAEITRLATDGTPNACSFLYGAARRIVQIMGYVNVTTLTLPDEGGASLRGAGFKDPAPAGGGDWSRERRPRSTADKRRKWRWTQQVNV
jgi:hypothetical protein